MAGANCNPPKAARVTFQLGRAAARTACDPRSTESPWIHSRRSGCAGAVDGVGGVVEAVVVKAAGAGATDPLGRSVATRVEPVAGDRDDTSTRRAAATTATTTATTTTHWRRGWRRAMVDITT